MTRFAMIAVLLALLGAGCGSRSGTPDSVPLPTCEPPPPPKGDRPVPASAAPPAGLWDPKGRLEHFALPGKGFVKDGNALAFDLNLTNYETYAWDADDDYWRWPVTLCRVDPSVKLEDGSLLTSHSERQMRRVREGRVGTLYDALAKFEIQWRKDAAKRAKENP